MAFNTVKSDLLGNVKVHRLPPLTSPWLSIETNAHTVSFQKLRERYNAATAESETLQALVLNELKTKKHTATEGLLWLVRYIYSSESLRI